ncbi:MAG: hypothetical protein GF421_10255 [Candidatus Aminicenantes bacterium]|nr:hypothetical protein [Candidatus Aminicenantes bacterium]
MRKITYMICSLFVFVFITAGEEVKYTENSLARLSFTTGNTFIQRAGDLAFEQGVVNMPVAQGDRVSTTEGRAEIHIGNGNYVRLDFNTKVDFTQLPTPNRDLIQIKLWTGNLIISLDSVVQKKSIELHTPDTSVYVLDLGLYRVNVRENQSTELYVYQGVAEAAGEAESLLIKKGQKLEAQRGYYHQGPLEFMAAGDSFYEWSMERDSILRQHYAQTYLPEELDDYEYELHTYGRWAHMAPYGYVWIPHNIGTRWHPYSNGRWLWYPICGWTWLPYEPWGWVTFHFGRWHWSINLGWYWIPRTRWAPAWVRWYRWNDYWAWVPLNYYGNPVVVINNVFYPDYAQDDYPSHSSALTVIHKDQLRAPNLSEIALNPSSIKEMKNATLYQSIPSVKDFPKPISVHKVNADKVVLHHSRDDMNINASRHIRNLKKPVQKQITNRKFGYPSSLRKTINRYISSDSDKKSKSLLGRALKYFSSGKSQYIKTRTDPSKGRNSSKVITSSTRRRTSSSSLSGRSSKSTSKSRTQRSASRTKGSSGSKKVKKKKK